ncbi:50S ribosomal protein L25/general stress protein Ctc [Bacillus sp. FJAT-29790]|uniref:50S ribosomal protein L25/general stress protein Ctc n=1 Tax=Bacillus sp. FJAT-29790 TaxID=1895002 RepID=UPI001C21658A|nr:50S ribosomal protein L25/general stress protein Ctc [Bacillus sp. FJAT-29790]MBU8881414.1 50S ribosomal protein L25/general stress protein Ctc [Bacillus sp. FJAT-29790]
MTTVLQAKERKEFRGSALTQIRQEGNIPAVVYGAKLESQSIYFNEKDFTKVIRQVGRNGVISLDLGGKKHNVVLSDYQANPLKNEIIHVDFHAVDMTQDITAHVRIVLTGDAQGVKDGGVMQQSLHEVSVTATPDNIPQSVEIDVTSLQVNETLTIGDIKSNRSYEINHEEEEVIASILPPRQEEEINSGEQQAGGHPENEEGRETKA